MTNWTRVVRIHSHRNICISLQKYLYTALYETDKELAQLTQERAQLQAIVDAQELSPADVDRMNAEREALKKNLDAVVAKAEQVNQMVWEKEIELQKKMDQVCHCYQIAIGHTNVDGRPSVEFILTNNTTLQKQYPSRSRKQLQNTIRWSTVLACRIRIRLLPMAQNSSLSSMFMQHDRTR
jgi:hypothetical protein